MSSCPQSQHDLFTHFDVAKPQPQPSPSTADGPPAAAPKGPRSRSARPEAPRGSLFLTDVAVAERYSVSRPTIWRWVKSLDGFPAPLRISEGTTRWRLADLEAWDEAQVTPRSSKTPRKGRAK